MKRLVLMCLVVVALLTTSVVPRAVYADKEKSDEETFLTAEEQAFVGRFRNQAAEVRKDMVWIRGLLGNTWRVGEESWVTAIYLSVDPLMCDLGAAPKEFEAVNELWKGEVCSRLSALRETLDDQPDYQPVGLFALWLDNINNLVEAIDAATNKVEAALDDRIIERIKEESEKAVMGSAGPIPIGECFIATAAYGTPAAAEINVLRQFRDEFLLRNPPGKAFVSIYYEVSPPIADFISEHEMLRIAVRDGFVDPVVKVVEVTRGWWGE
jgi:hypothetical protein